MTNGDAASWQEFLRQQAALGRCQCDLKDEGYPLVCEAFENDDQGDCMTCGHRKGCHERHP